MLLIIENQSASRSQFLPPFGDVRECGSRDVFLDGDALLAGGNNVASGAELVAINPTIKNGPVQIGPRLALKTFKRGKFFSMCLALAASSQQQQSNTDSLGLAQSLAFACSVLTPGAAGFFIQ